MFDSCKISLGADMTVCSQSASVVAYSTTLNAPSITWGGTISSNCTNCPFYYPETKTSGVYYIYITASKGACVVSDTLKLTVLPQIATSASFIKDTEICSNQKISLGDVANNANYTYKWSSVPTSVVTNSNNPSVTPSKSTSYYVTVTNGICPIPFLDTINIKVTQFNNLKLPLGDTIVCKNSTVQLCGVVPQTNATYKWSPSTYVTDITKLNTTFIPIANTAYTLEAKIGNCTANYNVNLKVTDLEILLAKAGPETTICKGEAIILALGKAKGIGTLSWFENGVKLSNKDNIGSITLKPQVTTNVVATFRFGGCIVKDSILVKVIDNFKGVFFNLKDSVFCSNQAISLKAIYPDGLFPDGTDLNWSVTNNTFKTINDSIFFVAKKSGIISLEMKNGNCMSTLTKPFIVKDLENIKLTIPSNKVCSGETVNILLQNPNSGGTLQWYENGVKINNLANIYTFIPKNNSKIKVIYESGSCIVSDSTNIEVFDNLKNTFITLSDSVICKDKKINAVLVNKNGAFSPNTSISWTIPNNSFTQKLDSIFIKADTTSTINVSVNNGVCKNTLSLPFEVKKTIDLTIVASKTSICQGEEITIEAITDSKDKISWSLDAKDYNCIGTDCKKITTKPQKSLVVIASGTSNQCMSSGGLSIKINPIPTYQKPFKTEYCLGDKLDSFLLNNLTNSLYKYTWQSNDLTFQTSNLAAPKVKPSKTTTYTVKMESNGCVFQDSFKIIVANQGFLTLTKDTTICIGTNLALEYKTNIDPNNIITAKWEGNSEINPTVEEAKPYTFNLEYKADGIICKVKKSVNVTSIGSPKLTLDYLPKVNTLSPIEFGKSIDLHAVILNPSKNLTYIWSVNNQKTSTKDSTYKLILEKPIKVEVFVKNEKGCTSYSFVNFENIDLPEVVFPSVILPNGTESANQKLRPYTKAKERREDIIVEFLKVYDRWGAEVYTEDNIRFDKDPKIDEDKGWDGKVNGEESVGVFIYVASYKVGQNGKTQTVKGQVSVLR